MKDERKVLEKELKDSFDRWEHYFHYGGQDPFWADGVNMNLIRNHIIYQKEQLKELEYFPEIYYRETPPEVDSNYMARPDEIREHAKLSLATYIADENFQYLSWNVGKVDEKTAKAICLGNVLGYVEGLKTFIENDSLIDMRRHEKPQNRLDSFRSCRKKLEAALKEQGLETGKLKIQEERTGQLRFW